MVVKIKIKLNKIIWFFLLVKVGDVDEFCFGLEYFDIIVFVRFE